MTAPASPAEQAAAEALARIHNRRVDVAFELEPVDFAGEALEVLDAVEPHLTIAALERTQTAIEQFAARKRKAGHRRDAVGIDEAAELVLDQLSTLRIRLSARSATPTERTDPK